MPVTLEQARQNTTDDIDLAIIDEFRTNSLMELLTFDDAVNPAGGGATLTYGYRRLAELATAGFRAINTEYTPGEVSTTRHTTELKVLGGSFQIDRVLANLGPAATNEVWLQMTQKVRAVQAEFGNAVINGDSAEDEDSFDGLSKALAGSSTEIDAKAWDWSDITEAGTALGILDALDDFLGNLDEQPQAIITNKAVIAKLRAAARRANMYAREAGPRDTYFETYGGIRLIDAGKRAGDNQDVIPVAADGTTDIYAVRFGLDGFHGVSTAGGNLVSQWTPDFDTPGAVKTGEVELGPVGVALKKTKAAAVARDVRVRPEA
ncbi:major capsid protein [Brachybacterium alimentarium]|uniref:major capsid protein n=1 Tax=Brachybacterium alimentarium TaxID=47845 RepID=UPI003FD247A4